MKSFRADSLSFRLPTSWDEVTFGQERALYAATSSLAALVALTGHNEAELRSLNLPTLNSIVADHLTFLQTRPDFSALAIPSTVTIPGLTPKTWKQRSLGRFRIGNKFLVGNKTITIPQHIGSQTTYGQKLDLDEELKKLDLPDDDDAALHVVAPLLLSIYLAPLITGKPYTDIEQARAVLPLLDALPCTIALPVAAFFFISYFSPTSSGQPSSHKSNPPTMTPPALHLN